MAKLTEEKIFEAFGLGAKAQEPAAPASEGDPVDTGTGENAQEVAAPAEVDTPSEQPEAQPAADADDETGASGSPEDKALTAEQRRANAARRRQQEQQAAIDRAVAEALEKERSDTAQVMGQFFAKAGLKNTFTGEAITSMEQYQAWEQQAAEKKLEADLKAGKLTMEGLGQAISNHPVIQQAQQLLDRENGAAAQRQAADNADIQRQIDAIHAIDPAISTVADLLKMPNYAQFKERVDRGYTFEDAYYLVNREKVEASRAEQTRQQALLNARGKEHLAPPNAARGTGALPVPADVMSLYRQLNPGMTEEQIVAHYNKVKKK